MRIFKIPQFLQVSVAPPLLGKMRNQIFPFRVFLWRPKMAILDRFSRSWTLLSNLLAMLRGAKMGLKSLQSGLEDGSQRGEAHLQFHREFSGSWRLGGGPRRSKIGPKWVRRGFPVHQFCHSSCRNTEKRSSENLSQNGPQKWWKKWFQDGVKMGSKIGSKSASETRSILGPSWDPFWTIFWAKNIKHGVFINLCNEIIKTHHVFTFFVVRFS